MMRLGEVNGSPYIGVYCAASETLALAPDNVDERVVRELGEALGVPVLRIYVAGSIVVGSLVAMNSHGVVLTNFAEKHEIARFPKELRIGKMAEKHNAAGNNILANDHAAYVNPEVSRSTEMFLQDVLGVEVQAKAVAGIETVGSACIATNKGVVCHPRTSEDELREISAFFKVPAVVASLNYGMPIIGACAVANSKGAYVGARSTPIELGRLEDGLGLF